MEKKCIVLADDHILIRHGIRKILEEEPLFEIVGEVNDGLQLLAIMKDTVPDLIVLDISMPHLRGIEAIGEIQKINPQTKILILTMHKSDQYLGSAMAAGADGYLLKEDSDTELLPAIKKILQGEIYISPSLKTGFSDDTIQSCLNRRALPDPLTLREKQVLQLVAEGQTSRNIAEMLKISKRTVDHHRANIMKKLNIKTTADLIRYAIKKGFTVSPAR